MGCLLLNFTNHFQVGILIVTLHVIIDLHIPRNRGLHDKTNELGCLSGQVLTQHIDRLGVHRVGKDLGAQPMCDFLTISEGATKYTRHKKVVCIRLRPPI